MTYSANEDLFSAFGRTNVRKWADLNNNDVGTEITARMLWAREAAYAELNDKLRTSPYQFPLTGTAPDTVVRMEAYLAGVLLYESRGVTDHNPVTGASVHALAWAKSRVDEFVRDIFSRRITLDIAPAVATSEVPFVVNDHATDPDFAGEPAWPETG